MWRYIVAALLIFIGAIELLLALNPRMRNEIMKNSPIPLPSAAPYYFFFAGLSAMVMALGLIFYHRIF
ncbi:MAG: hypothetical protein QOJ88_367 [Pyrinomonadaceae bacterium]|jgi:hypothetical protein|nr:hypothetical protein [Pyrinomonadaceae bacterium]